MRCVLPTIVIAQFLCTSLWFAGNAIIPDIITDRHFTASLLPHITSAIQLGFIAGTLVFAIFTISDRFSPSLVFFISAMLAGLSNLGVTINNIQTTEILLFRFLTGFFLAGIYPVGMKIAADHYKAGLGRSLGFLVGALVIGTAFPHLLKNFTTGFPWKYVLYATTILSISGGCSILFFVPNGPYRKPGQKLKLSTFIKGFRNRNFRAASFGYFGHMWELYAFWAFVPVMLTTYNNYYGLLLNIPLCSFLIIASGGLACVCSGMLSQYYSAKTIATISLSLSCLCCFVSPLFLLSHSLFVLLVFLFVWSVTVIADSPLFSTLVAQSAPEESRGTSLTIVNCIGFSITVISIQLIGFLANKIDPQYVYLVLAVGPIMGLIALIRNKNYKSELIGSESNTANKEPT